MGVRLFHNMSVSLVAWNSQDWVGNIKLESLLYCQLVLCVFVYINFPSLFALDWYYIWEESVYSYIKVFMNGIGWDRFLSPSKVEKIEILRLYTSGGNEKFPPDVYSSVFL